MSDLDVENEPVDRDGNPLISTSGEGRPDNPVEIGVIASSASPEGDV